MEQALVNYLAGCANIGPERYLFANLSGPDTTPESLHDRDIRVIQELLDEPVLMPQIYQSDQLCVKPSSNSVLHKFKYLTLAHTYSLGKWLNLKLTMGIAFK